MKDTTLQSGEEIVCLLCRAETTEVKENKGGKPYVYCDTFDAVINLRTVGTEQAQAVLDTVVGKDSPRASLESQLNTPALLLHEDDSTEDDGSSETVTMADIVGNSDP